MRKPLTAFFDYLLFPFSWSQWEDIETFSFGGSAYLLQGRKNYRSNAKKFRVTPTKRFWQTADIGRLDMKKLESVGLITPKPQ